MAKKRKLADREGHRRDEARVDPIYGQRSAIPGLDDASSDGNLSDETSVEAIAYLRSVRLEAQGIPALLCAPVIDDIDSAEHTLQRDRFRQGGRYVDGTYIAAPEPGSRDASENDHQSHDADYNSDVEPDEDYTDDDHNGSARLVEPRQAYHLSLLARFAAHRSSYHLRDPSSPNPTTYADLDPSTHPTRVNHSVPASREFIKWNHLLQTTAPRSAQMAAMSQDTVLWLLERVPSMLKRTKWTLGESKRGTVLGAWIWALLGRLNELGTLSSEEVSIVRELGKRAGSVIVGIELARDDELDSTVGDVERAGETDAHEADERVVLDVGLNTPKMGAHGDNDMSNDPQSQTAVDEAKARLLSAYASSDILHTDEPRPKTTGAVQDCPRTTQQIQEDSLYATLDMILTVVGEYYGQRDLLIARDRLWESTVN